MTRPNGQDADDGDRRAEAESEIRSLAWAGEFGPDEACIIIGEEIFDDDEDDADEEADNDQADDQDDDDDGDLAACENDGDDDSADESDAEDATAKVIGIRI